MKALLFIGLFIITSSVAAPVSESEAKVLAYENTSDGKGNYMFSFETSNGISRSESGTVVFEGKPEEYIEVRGFYSYTDPDGKIVNINYMADQNGYRIITLKPTLRVAPAVVASLLGR